MIYVGIDIAKLNHFASIISSDGEVLVEPFKFSNDSGGFRLLLSKLDPDSLVIGLESTAHYGNNLVEFLVSRHFHVCVINPIQTSAIPGISCIEAGMILGEIGDIHRFSSPSKLLAFAGLDPSVYQSGNFNASHTRMSKRGSRVLRYALL